MSASTEVYTPERARALNAFGEGLRERLNATVRRRGLAMQFTGLGSMIGVHMTDAPIHCEQPTRPRATPGSSTSSTSISWRAASGSPSAG